MSKILVCGVGINDADYNIRLTIKGKRVWFCPYYRLWANRLSACYTKSSLKRKPTYKGCTVSEEWLTFSNFRLWCVSEENLMGRSVEGLHLDKDILSEGVVKIYSSKTCVFVPQEVNKFITDSKGKRGVWPIGVSENKGTKVLSLAARCRNPLVTGGKPYIGCFACPYEAHYAWKARKHGYAIKLANSEYVTDERVRQRLLTMYAPDTDHLEGWVWDKESSNN